MSKAARGVNRFTPPAGYIKERNHDSSHQIFRQSGAAVGAHGEQPCANGRQKALTLGGANRVIAAAIAEAKRLNAPGAAIAVVDDGGNLVAVERLDDTFAAGANISIGKARTAALFKKPTKAFEDTINKGRTTMVTVLGDVQGFTPL
ncbi:MAG: GlcG/HbpS family heme-binding protein [Burkholderiales bacterium]|nr:heme-binding protein [Pseudomonadota bacterium]